MSLKCVRAGHYTGTINYGYNKDIVVHITKNKQPIRHFTWVANWRVPIDDRLLNKSNDILGDFETYKEAKIATKRHVEGLLLDDILHKLKKVFD